MFVEPFVVNGQPLAEYRSGKGFFLELHVSRR